MNLMTTNELEELRRIRALTASGAARAARQAAHLSLAELAGPCETWPSTIYRWEKGLQSPHGRSALTYGRLIGRLLERA